MRGMRRFAKPLGFLLGVGLGIAFIVTLSRFYPGAWAAVGLGGSVPYILWRTRWVSVRKSGVLAITLCASLSCTLLLSGAPLQLRLVPWVPILVQTLLLLGGLFALGYFISNLKLGWSIWLVLAILLIVIAFSMSTSPPVSGWPEQLSQKMGLLSSSAEVFSIVLRAAIHLVLFALLGWCLMKFCKAQSDLHKTRAWKAVPTTMLVVSVVAFFVAIRQSYISGLGGTVYDVFIAMTGAFIAALACSASASSKPKLA